MNRGTSVPWSICQTLKKTTRVLKVYEAARYEGGVLSSREYFKLIDYNAAKIPSHFEEVK